MISLLAAAGEAIASSANTEIALPRESSRAKVFRNQWIIVPLMFIGILLEKHIIKGMTAGAVK